MSHTWCYAAVHSLWFVHFLSQASSKPMFGVSKGPTGVFKSVLDTNRTDGRHKDEIFVDVVEKLTCTFSASGNVISSQIDGAIQVWCQAQHLIDDAGWTSETCQAACARRSMAIAPMSSTSLRLLTTMAAEECVPAVLVVTL